MTPDLPDSGHWNAISVEADRHRLALIPIAGQEVVPHERGVPCALFPKVFEGARRSQDPLLERRRVLVIHYGKELMRKEKGLGDHLEARRRDRHGQTVDRGQRCEANLRQFSQQLRVTIAFMFAFFTKA